MQTVTVADGIRLTGFDPATLALPSAPAESPFAMAAPPVSATDTAIARAMADAGMPMAADLIVAPPGLAGRVDVDVAGHEQAVVLAEQDGAFRWLWPDTGTDDALFAVAPADAVPRTVHFRVAPAGAVAVPPPLGIAPIAAELAEPLLGPIRLRIARFAAGMAIDELVARIEGDLAEGLVVMQGPAEGWTVSAASPPLPRPGQPLRVLLFVHGTFSTTRGSFGPLGTTDSGRAFLAGADSRYDLMLGIDHRTLSSTPGENAALIADALAFLPDGTTVDAVGFSRGGLVLRDAIARLHARLQFGRLVFVGCTNAGTHLAAPENWQALVDLHTSLLVATCRALAPVSGPLATMLAEQAIRLIARFVQAMPDIGITDERVPGLAEMRPHSATISRLAAAGAMGPAVPAVHAVAAEFEPAGGLAALLADRLADSLFDTANDLVVDTASMTDFGAAASVDAARLLRLPASAGVHHTAYFATPQVADRLARWLLH